MSPHLPSWPKSSRPQYERPRPQDEDQVLLTWNAMLIWLLFSSSPSRFHSWAACGDLQGNQNERRRTSSQRQILVSLDCAREDCSGSLWHENRRWIQVFINSHLLQTKIGLPRTKALKQKRWQRCFRHTATPWPTPPPILERKKELKKLRYLRETQLWKNANLS